MNLSRLLSLGQAARRDIALGVLIGLLLNATWVAQAYLLSQLFTALFVHDDLHRIPTLLVALAIILLVRPPILLIREGNVFRIGTRVKSDVRTRMIRKLRDIGPFGLTRERSGSLQGTFTDGVEYLEPYLGRYVPQLVISAVMMAVTGTLMILIHPVVGVVTLAAAALAPLIPPLWDRALTRHGYNNWEMYTTLNSEVVDSMQGMTTLSLFNAVSRRRQAMNDTAQGLFRATMQQMKISLIRSGINAFLVMLGPATALATTVILVRSGDLALDKVFWILFLSFEVFRPLLDLASSWHSGYMGRASGRIILDVLATDSLTDVPAADTPGGGSQIIFDKVHYTYPGTSSPVLEDFTLTVPSGAKLAIVGESGCGKSTVIGLLTRLGDPQQGRVLVGGADLRSLTERERTALISLVPQDPVLFTGTIRENLLLAAPDAEEKEMLRLLTAIGLDSLAAGQNLLEISVGERGALLSGGQRQRLCIARALLRRSPILVLDEATSSLDGETEALVHELVDETRRQRLREGLLPLTVVMVTHRLNVVESADHVIVMNAGRIVEAGTHEELLSRGGRYATMINASHETVVTR